jgi:hypothetical protein
MLLVFYMSDELGTEFAMSHDLKSTIVSLNTTFKSAKVQKQKKTTKKNAFRNHENIHTKHKTFSFIFIIIILLLLEILFEGLAIYWEGVRFPPQIL